MRRGVLAVTITLLAIGTACKPEEETELPLCKQEVAGSEAEESKTGKVAAHIWFGIMLRDYNPKTAELKRPERNCAGGQVHAALDEGEARCLAGDAPARPLPARPLVEDDLMITPTDDDKLLIWIKTTHYDNGEARGPIGLVEWTQRGVAVRVLGSLKAQTNKAAMHLEAMGTGKVLVVESRECDPENPKKCHRLMRLMPLAGKAFIERPLVLEGGECVGPPEIALYRDRTVTLSSGLIRTFELARSVDFTDGNVVISEQVTIKDQDPTQPEAPPSLFRKANVKRPLRVAKAGIVTKPGLWKKMLGEHGSVRVRERKEADAKPEPSAGP